MGNDDYLRYLKRVSDLQSQIELNKRTISELEREIAVKDSIIRKQAVMMIQGGDDTKKVKIKLLPGGKMPTKGTQGAAAWDCYANEDIFVGYIPKAIGLGFALELPEGYHAKILPRSSTGLKTSLRMSNSFGLIDSDYRGEVKALYECRFAFRFTEDEAKGNHYVVRKGERIAQMLIEKNTDTELVEVSALSDTERGEGGFGSTGK